MAGTNSIDTNPEALRSIASSIITYTSLQYDIIRTYLGSMTSLEGEINIRSYQQRLEAIGEWLKTMDRLRADGESFAAWLNSKADVLDALYGGSNS